MAALRTVVAPSKGKLRGVAARAPFDGIIGRTIAPEGVTYHEDVVGGIPGWWCVPAGAPASSALLHLHGGWFNLGTAQAYRHLVGHIARAAQVRAFVPDYRLAPEHPFPAAPDDVLACYRGLVASGVQSIAVTGDSAGGNLALGLLSRLAAAREGVQTVGAVVLSPITDLAMKGESWTSRADADPYFLREQAEGLIAAYLDSRDATDPLASPLTGRLSGLLPIRLHVGEDEVLLDDSLRYAAQAVAEGVDAHVDVWAGMPHGFVGGVGGMQAAGAALQTIGAFLTERFADAVVTLTE
jgi:acetyl esterase/lipase